MRSFIRRVLTARPVTAYFALTFAISWGGALLAIGGAGGMRGTTPGSDPRFAYALIAMSVLLVGLAVGASAGVFEELGWTGFATPALGCRRRPLPAGLIIGVWWSAWHLLPNVWSSRAASGELAVPIFLAATAVSVFVGYLTAFRILMVWVYDHTRSVVLAMLMHASLTASLLVLNPLDIAGADLLIYSFALAAAVWILVAAVAAVERRRFAGESRRGRAA